jgi:hypothetical protein
MAFVYGTVVPANGALLITIAIELISIARSDARSHFDSSDASSLLAHRQSFMAAVCAIA